MDLHPGLVSVLTSAGPGCLVSGEHSRRGDQFRRPCPIPTHHHQEAEDIPSAALDAGRASPGESREKSRARGKEKARVQSPAAQPAANRDRVHSR
jgi:hypothetical protein